MNWRLQTPWTLVICRAILGPAITMVARLPNPEAWLGTMAAFGFASDVYDGFLARRWGTAGPALRAADSSADTVFYLGILAAVVERHWPLLRARLALLAALLALEVLRVLFDWMKFRRVASYHSYAAKIWGVLLIITTLALLCFNRSFWLLTTSLAWGIACDLEGLAMSLLLPQWTHDVKSLPHAVILRRELRAGSGVRAR